MTTKLWFAVSAGLALVASASCSALETLRPAGEKASGVAPARQELAPGLEYVRAYSAEGQGPLKWFISMGVARNSAEAAEVASCASQLRLHARRERFVFQGVVPVDYVETLVGEFPTRAQAQGHLDRYPLTAGCVPEVKASRTYPTDHTAPVVIHILRLDPSRFTGKLTTARGNGDAIGRSKPTTVLRRANALAVTNAGFFVMEPGDGIVGESTGISIVAGVLQSEPTKDRPWALIKNGPRVRVTFHDKEPNNLPALILKDGKRIQLDGVNRVPGVLRNCGALLDKSVSIAMHDVTCTPQHEIIALTDAEAVETIAIQEIGGYRFRQGDPLATVPPGMKYAPGETVLVATGNRRSELASLAASGQSTRLSMGATTGDSQTFAVNGGPMLVTGGKIVHREDVQGWPFAGSSLPAANAMHRFINLRAPRTAMGVTASGEILIVVVDGWRFRQDGEPAIPMNGGATIRELADLMQELGAQDAINLDGGGSSAMALESGLVSHPSDRDGERAVGDSLLVIPGRRS